LFCLCRPSSLDAIFLAHALVVLQAFPVSYVNTYRNSDICFKLTMDALVTSAGR
jgi:hypothetical protein